MLKCGPALTAHILSKITSVHISPARSFTQSSLFPSNRFLRVSRLYFKINVLYLFLYCPVTCCFGSTKFKKSRFFRGLVQCKRLLGRGIMTVGHPSTPRDFVPACQQQLISFPEIINWFILIRTLQLEHLFRPRRPVPAKPVGPWHEASCQGPSVWKDWWLWRRKC